MIERPILFKDRLVRALLREENPKTQTRRVGPGASRWLKLHRGDTLWVREATWRTHLGWVYRATYANAQAIPRWTPSIHMPRAASRITLELTHDPAMEPLQAMTEEDARVEGAEDLASFRLLWDSINHVRGYGWDANPGVVVLRFRRIG